VENNAARNGWIILGLGVAAYDYLAPPHQTLSEGVDRALDKHPVLTSLAIGTVALHLLNILPPEYDPIHKIATVIRHD
jgi:hypothetical protein